MAKIRVHELSKQLNISNKDIIDTLGAKGIEIKSHMSNLDDSMVGIIKAKFGAKTAPKAEAPKAETPKPAAPKQEAPRQRLRQSSQSLRQQSLLQRQRRTRRSRILQGMTIQQPDRVLAIM